ncbi:MULTISPECIES: large-conductance mechanosensitive channel protein MscL [Bacillus]|uniref:large-conductance mechanosensitive channel protein MscL n=1 Tax=Bacillus TaxID=1386 RepID=UPI0002EAF60C|nr:MULTISPECIES: large-conductance mechanosensitive channel protein MscL [Bacillus]
MWQEFKKFIDRGNVLDLAVGVVVGTAFGKIITSFVEDVLMPPIGLLIGKVDFTDLYINLSGKDYPSLAAAKSAGAATINYGLFLNNVINFLIISFCIFIVIRQINKFTKKKEQPAPTTKKCPACLSEIAIEATRCPACTSFLDEEKAVSN